MKNYTSIVPPARSVEMIEQLLVKFGALGVTKQYAKGVVSGLSFIIEAPDTKLPVSILLPAQTEAAHNVLLEAAKKKNPWLSDSKKQAIREQADRTAWRIVHDWVAIQLSMIEMRQAELRQVFLPYITSANGQTIYQFLKEKRVPALGYTAATTEAIEEQP